MKPDKYVRGLVALILFFSVFNSLFYVNTVVTGSILPKFYVDDNYDNSTPGWQVDHFDTIQDAIDSPDCGSGDRIALKPFFCGVIFFKISISRVNLNV